VAQDAAVQWIMLHLIALAVAAVALVQVVVGLVAGKLHSIFSVPEPGHKALASSGNERTDNFNEPWI
jgi:hypothetical protein